MKKTKIFVDFVKLLFMQFYEILYKIMHIPKKANHVQ